MKFIDVHTHLLPGIDDGSPDVETSLQMLRKWKEQGVKKIVATPHFDFRDVSVERFLEQRQNAYEKLLSAVRASGEELCDIMLGAEIMYSSNMFGFIDLSALSIGETPFVLVEFATELSAEKVSNIVASRSRSDVILILAHAERYKSFGFLRKLKKLRDADVLFQVNFSSFLPSSPFRGTAEMMMKNDLIDLFATDAHGINVRNPDFSEVLRGLYREHGRQKTDRILNRSYEYFG